MKNIACTLLFSLLAFSSCQKNDAGPEPTPVLPQPSAFPRGADVSWVTEMEAAGRKFYNSAGIEQDLFLLLKSLGMNTVRLRVWVNPSNGWNGKDDVVAKAVRAKNIGFHLLIDFHYSDSWADPGKQTKPAAWATQDINSLKASMAAHTTDVLTALKTAGVTPKWVQVGNETNDGLLWPEGKASANMASYAQLITAGYDAVKNVFPDAKVVVHLSNGWDNALFRWNIGGLVSNGAKFDVIGMSLYPSFVAGGWQAANQQCLANMNDMVASYGKDVMIVEAGMPWDDALNCKAFLTDMIAKTKSVAGNRGLGVLYWEPEAYGNWQGYTLGAFDNTGKPTIALDAFKE